MGHIGSQYPEIKNITIHPWPAKPTAGVAIMRCDNTVVGVGPNGAVYSNRFNKKAYYTFPWKGTEDLLICLVKLGKIPARIYDAHCQEQDRRTTISDRGYAAESVLREAATAGITLSTAQRAKLTAAAAALAAQ